MLERIVDKDTSRIDTSNEAYLASLGDARTARHASEQHRNSPKPEDTHSAINTIRKDIAGVFQDTSEELHEAQPQDLATLKSEYWQRAGRVGTESGAIAGYELEDYLRVGRGRSYDEIKQAITLEYPKESIPNQVLDGIDAYYQALQINPAHAATIMMETIGRHLAEIEIRANELGGANNPAAVSQAFSEFITEEVPSHVRFIAAEYGLGDEAIHSNMYRRSFYPSAVSEPGEHAIELTLTEDEASGLVEVYDIQSRPYEQSSLQSGNNIAQLPEMQVAMLSVHEDLIDMSARYLEAHPERAAQNLENFSEIFVPEYAEDGSIRELLPNPKLVRSIVNNVLPAVALAIHRRSGSVHSVSSEDINEGIRIAHEEYRLFQTRIGQFNNYNDENQTVDLLSTYRVVCPANSIFPKFLSAKLANYFEDARESLVTD